MYLISPINLVNFKSITALFNDENFKQLFDANFFFTEAAKSISIEEIYCEADLDTGNNQLYSIILVNNHAFLTKTPRSIIIKTFLYKNTQIISYLGKDLSKDQIKYILDSIRILE